MAQEATTTTQIIGPVRFSYLSVFKPRLNKVKQPPTPEYSVQLLIPKQPNKFCPNPEAIIAQIKEMVKTAGAAKFGATKYKVPLKDGDKIEEGDDEPRNPGYWTVRVSASAEYPPTLLDGQGMTAHGGWESGDWGKVKVKAWCYDNAGNKGVSLGLWAVQFLYKDEPLGSSSDPSVLAKEFGTVEDADRPEVLAGVGPAVSGDEYDPFADE